MKNSDYKTERRYTSQKVRAVRADDGKITIRGYAAVFDSMSENLGGFREKIEPGAFRAVLKKADCRALINHDANLIIGRQSAGTLRLREDRTGLLMEVDLPDTQYARDLAVSIERGDINQQSFGFRVRKDSWEENRESGEVTRTIIELEELLDVSPVTFPAYPDTTVAKRSLEAFKAAGTGGNDTGATAGARKKHDEKREKFFRKKGWL